MRIFIALLFLIFPNIVMADEYYLGQWVWDTSIPERPIWVAPHLDKVTGTLDLRSIPQQSIPGGEPQGYAIFSYSEQINDPNLTHIGNYKDILTLKQKGDFEDKLGVDSLRSNTVKDLIYEVLTEKSDPTGQNGVKPLMPDKNLDIKLKVGEVQKVSKLIPFVSPEWHKVLAVIHEDYKRLIETENHIDIAKWLDMLEEQYGVSYRTFIPEDAVIKLASLPHQTTITEDWNCSDADSPDCDLDWTEVSGDFDISSNRILMVTLAWATQFLRANSDLSSANHYAEVTWYQYDGQAGNEYHMAGVGVRKDSTATLTFYGATIEDNGSGSSGDRKLFKFSSGTGTQIGSTSNVSYSVPFDIRLEVDGSTLTYYYNGSSIMSETDTAITGNTRVGVTDTQGPALFSTRRSIRDDFEAADLVASSSASPSVSGTIFSGVGISGM